jgi:hypothetical protein
MLPVRRWWLRIGAALLALAAVGFMTSLLAVGALAREGTGRVAGAGKTIIEGGTGGASPLPVTTLVAFHANAQGGDFECLALAPPAATGSGSGDFTVNVMYVTGKVTSVDLVEGGAVLHGTATVTGIGAGQNQPFTAQVTSGGPGATITLEVSGQTFHEILVEGQINAG